MKTGDGTRYYITGTDSGLLHWETSFGGDSEHDSELICPNLPLHQRRRVTACGLSSGGGALCGAEMAPLRSAAVSIGGRKYARRQAEHTRQNSTEIDPAAPTGCSREDERWSKQPRPRYADEPRHTPCHAAAG